MGEPVECFAWSLAENLDRDECTPGPPGDRDWNGECLGEDGVSAQSNHTGRHPMAPVDQCPENI